MRGPGKPALFFMRHLVCLFLFVSLIAAEEPKRTSPLPPKTVKAGLHTWKVEQASSEIFDCGDDHNAIGCADPQKLLITYAKGLSFTEEQVVIWHEVKHAAMEMGITALTVGNEGCVEWGAAQEVQILQENPDLVTYLRVTNK